MTSLEKVQASIKQMQPERISVDSGVITGSGISAITCSSLVGDIERDEQPVLFFNVIRKLAQSDDA
jgi:hypothetical protein